MRGLTLTLTLTPTPTLILILTPTLTPTPTLNLTLTLTLTLTRPTVTRPAAWGEPAVSAMLLLLALLGGSLLGALPFCLQQCALACAPAGENLTSALLYAVAI